MRLHRRLLYVFVVALLAVPAAAVACVKAFDEGSAGSKQSDAYVESDAYGQSRGSDRKIAPWDSDEPCATGAAAAGAPRQTGGAAYVQSSESRTCGASSAPAPAASCRQSNAGFPGATGAPTPTMRDRGDSDDKSGSSDDSDDGKSGSDDDSDDEKSGSDDSDDEKSGSDDSDDEKSGSDDPDDEKSGSDDDSDDEKSGSDDDSGQDRSYARDQGSTGRGGSDVSGAQRLTGSPCAAAQSPAGVQQPGNANGPTYYVSPSGDDGQDGKSASAPLRSIQKALDVASSGSIVVLGPGVYEQDVQTTQPGVTITGPPDAIVTGAGADRVFQVRHDGITLSGFTIDGLYGSESSAEGYRDKLVYVMGTNADDGVEGLRILGMTIKNAGGECVRLRYLVTRAEVAGSVIGPCGVYDFKFDGGGKNGEGVYIGTAPEQKGGHGAPGDAIDVSRDNWIHHNRLDTQGNECVDIKEGSTANIVEQNECTGQRDPESAGLDSRGSGNTFRYNAIYGNVGAGIRFGGDSESDGRDNDAYGNLMSGNEAGGIKFQATPQRHICGNQVRGAAGDTAVGSHGSQFDPAASCQSSEDSGRP